MKIKCWEDLEILNYIGNGVWNVKGTPQRLIERESCMCCGCMYLTNKYQISDFCNRSCAMLGKNNPMFGKKRPEVSERMKGKNNHMFGKTGKDNPMFGKTHTKETKDRMRKKRISVSGENNPSYKGGVVKLGITLYDTYAHQISYAEEVRRDPENYNWLQIKCAYCGQWFLPSMVSIGNRIGALEGRGMTENRFYCSENCKQACPIYKQRKYPKNFKHATSREVDPQLRQMVLERDNWICQVCGKTVEEAQLHCHHMDPATQNPMFQNDMNSCITLCKNCHKEVHLQYGCRYVDLKCVV